MNEEAVVGPLLVAHLAAGLQEGQALDVAGGPADLGDDHVHVALLARRAHARLDLVGDVRHYLHGLAQVTARALALDHRLVDLAGGDAVVEGETLVEEAFVVAEIEIRLAAVVGDEDLAVLERAHGARVHVEIGIELLNDDTKPALLEEQTDGCRRDALAER